jgi:hypothetical protein
MVVETLALPEVALIERGIPPYIIVRVTDAECDTPPETAIIWIE